ncbi:MAG: cupin domain-containing protein [Flavobacteriales bacterium]
MVIDIKNLTPYNWGTTCQAWKLVDSSALSVVYEEMPAGEAENLHKHVNVQQLFFILEGEAMFEMNGIEYRLIPQQSIYVYPGVAHRIYNNSGQMVKFLVISNPHSHYDRVDL